MIMMDFVVVLMEIWRLCEVENRKGKREGMGGLCIGARAGVMRRVWR